MKPNILFFTIDSFRADKFSGESRSCQTPNIDLMVERGTYFTQAIPCSDGTTLSLNSFFTGLFPFETETRAQKLLLKKNNYINLLKDAGYHISGLMPGTTSFSSLADYCENKDKTYGIGPPVETISDGLGQRIVDLLRSKMQKPWFYYVHAFDLHWPPFVPKEFNKEKFGDSDYERAVSALDFWLGKIFEEVDKKETLVVLTADHGALIPKSNKYYTDFEPDLKPAVNVGKKFMPTSTHKFGAKFFVWFNDTIRTLRLKNANRNLTPYEKRSRLPYFTLSLFDESLRIPLLFYGYTVGSKKITQQVRTIDIFPTIANIASLPKLKKRIHGQSLLPLFNSKNLPELPSYLHSMPYEKISPNDIVGIRTSKHKFFRGVDNPNDKINLYDLKVDPHENYNIAKDNPNVVKEMEELLGYITSQRNFDEDVKEIGENELRKIKEEYKKLGYI